MSDRDDIIEKLFLGAIAGISGYYTFTWILRKSLKNISNSFLHRLMVDKYQENLWEFVSATRKVGLQNIVETNLRAQEGKLLQRPLGSPKSFPNFDKVMFDFAQIHKLPTDEGKKTNTEVIIGPKANKPL